MGSGAASSPQIVLVSKRGPTLGRTVLVAGLAGLLGAAATLGVIAGTDAFVRERPGNTSVERYAVDGRVPGDTELEIADGVLPSVARVEAVGGPHGVVNSTAVVFRSDGHLLTTADAVDAADTITVYLNDGSKLPAQLVSRSIQNDVAVLKIDRTDLPVAVVSQQRTEFGDGPIMIDASNASRGPEIFLSLVTKESTRVERSGGNPTVYGLIETTTRSTGERSAGTVLVDSSGSVIGLITRRTESGSSSSTPTSSVSVAVSADDTNAVHYAYPADLVWNIAGQLTDTGQILKPWIGITKGRDLDRDEAQRRDVAGGVFVTLVDIGSPAQNADIRVGDVITGIDDAVIGGFNDLDVATRRLQPGNQVKVSFIRDGELYTKIFPVAGQPELP